MVKMALLVLLGTLAVLAFVLVYSEIYFRNIILEDAETNASNLASSVARHMDQELRSVAKVVENLAISLEYAAWDEKDLLELIRRVVKENNEIYGSAIAYEPYEFRADLKEYAPYYFKEKDGLKLVQLGADAYGYANKDWYRIPLDMKKAMWSAPYYDEGGGDALMTTFASPFFQRGDHGRAGKVRGIIGADITLDRLTQMASDVHVLQTGYAFLISEYGGFLAHPERSWVMRESMFSIAEERGEPVLAEIGRQMIRNKSGFVDLGRALTGKDSFLAYHRLPSTGWSLGVVLPKGELFAQLASLHKTIAFLAIIGIALLLVVSFLVARSITSPLRRMAQATGTVAAGNLDIDLPDARRQDEVGQLATAFMGMAQDLKRYIEDLTRTTAAKQRIESELSIAATIQKSMLPNTFPPFPGRDELDIYALMRPAKEVGGDFYDFFLIDEHHLCVVVGDVSGKGVPAALFMSVTKYLVEAVAAEGAPPEEILRRVNGQLARNNESCMFVTLFAGILDLKTGELSYANAGHNPPITLTTDGQTTFLERPGGPILGVMDDATFRMDRLFLKPGEVLLAYTDGVTEAANTAGEFFAEDKLETAMKSFIKTPSQEIAKSLLNEIDMFCRDAPQTDDITILAVRYKPSA
jgi:sigma-B regulation protein RsbU (phosphoserine phosphatase)